MEFRGKIYIFTIKINARKKHIIFFRLQMMTKLFIVDYINLYIIFRVKKLFFTLHLFLAHLVVFLAHLVAISCGSHLIFLHSTF